jgi:precorrin-3B synthase
MADAPLIQGWCPGALRPMPSGDGLVVRIRPRAGRLSQTQAAGIAQLARSHGNGLIDLSNRANLQLRGVTAASHPPLIEGLRALGLIDASPEAEGLRNIIVTPFWTTDDGTQTLATDLATALALEAPDLPAKFGFAIDGQNPVLREVSVDIWLEQTPETLLLATTKGAKTITRANAIAETMALIRWFLAMGGVQQGRGRMAQLLARSPLPPGFTARRAAPAAKPKVGPHPLGLLAGFEFGQMRAETLAEIAQLGPIRTTPWRMLLIEGAHRADIEGVINDPANPMLRVVACTGAPGCTQAHAATRALARALAPHVKTLLHVSGCAKGCAHPAPAPLTLTATPVGFDLIRDGSASGAPARIALSPDQLVQDPSLLTKAP